MPKFWRDGETTTLLRLFKDLFIDHNFQMKGKMTVCKSYSMIPFWDDKTPGEQGGYDNHEIRVIVDEVVNDWCRTMSADTMYKSDHTITILKRRIYVAIKDARSSRNESDLD